VVLLYPDFISAIAQEPTVKVLLPFSKTGLKDMLLSLLPQRYRRDTEQAMAANAVREYLFEPSQETILSTILPQLTEIQIYQAVLETAASEHSARMVAMRNASAITGELAELSASKAALE